MSEVVIIPEMLSAGMEALLEEQKRSAAQHFEACWRLAGTTVLILDSDGDPTPISAAAFRPDLPI